MIAKEVTKIEEVKYFEKKYKYILKCDHCGKVIYEGEDKQRLQDKIKETYRITRPIYGKMGVEGEKEICFCDNKCFDDYIYNMAAEKLKGE